MTCGLMIFSASISSKYRIVYLVGQFFHRNAELVGMVDDFIFNIGDIFDVFYFITAIFQIAAHNIKDHVAHRMTEMRISIRVHAARHTS